MYESNYKDLQFDADGSKMDNNKHLVRVPMFASHERLLLCSIRLRTKELAPKLFISERVSEIIFSTVQSGTLHIAFQ